MSVYILFEFLVWPSLLTDSPCIFKRPKSSPDVIKERMFYCTFHVDSFFDLRQVRRMSSAVERSEYALEKSEMAFTSRDDYFNSPESRLL